MALKKSMSKQLEYLKKDFNQGMQKFCTAVMDDRIAQLLQQPNQIRECMSKTVFNLHLWSLQSNINVVKTLRELDYI